MLSLEVSTALHRRMGSIQDSDRSVACDHLRTLLKTTSPLAWLREQK
jgi:hypothetical protein